jgi:phage-related protein
VGRDSAGQLPQYFPVIYKTNPSGFKVIDGLNGESPDGGIGLPWIGQGCFLYPFVYNFIVSNALKTLHWVGSSKKDLLAIPCEVVDVFGFALHLAQSGKKHDQAKPLKGFGGASVLDVVEDHMGDAYRAVYTVKIAEKVYVLHCFQKKSTKGIETPKQDMELIRERLKAVLAHAKGV